MSSPQVLADTLRGVSEAEYVRFVAHWLTHASDLDAEPVLTGVEVIDALVAAAAAHVGFTSPSALVPAWTESPSRHLDSFWYPGPDAFFANALVQAPLTFRLHGVLIEADSLVSV